jgi:hypothetical protein
VVSNGYLGSRFGGLLLCDGFVRLLIVRLLIVRLLIVDCIFAIGCLLFGLLLRFEFLGLVIGILKKKGIRFEMLL